MKLKFTRIMLDSMLNDIRELVAEGYLLESAIDAIKEAYKDEIETLQEGPVWIKEGDRSEHSA